MKVRPPSPNVTARTLHFATACALLACTLSTGCKSPWGWWGGNSGGTYGSAAPDVGKQRYDGLSQDFSGGAAGAYKSPSAANEGYVSSAWKKSTAAVGSVFAAGSSKPATTDDPTSLDSKTKEIKPEVFMAAANMYETQGKYKEAFAQYEKGLKAEPGHLATMVSIARLHDRMGNFPKAIEAYQRAAKVHPKSGLVQNDMGLCYARQKDTNNAVAALTRACEYAPKTEKYRNNLAALLVESGRPDDAFKQLRAVSPEAVAHYNIGYMLTARGQKAEAIQHLQLAVGADPEMKNARALLAQLTGVPEQTMVAQTPPPPQDAPFVAHPPVSERDQALSMFQANRPQRPAPSGPSPFQNASQSSSGPVEIVFPTAPANSQQSSYSQPQPVMQPPAAAPGPAFAPPTYSAPAATEDGSFRIGDEEGPQLLPPVAE